jgi:hypothetical protein
VHRPPAPDTGANIDDLIPADSAFRPLFPGKHSRGNDAEEEVFLLREENVGL